MNRFRVVLEIAQWEFFRWFKLKDQLITFLIAIVMSIAFGWGQALLDRSDTDPVNLVVLSENQIVEAFSPFNITVTHDQPAREHTTLAERISAGILIGLMFLGVFYSAGSQFVAITGEKQLRVTEQILSAVTPQQWIDGKILGLSAFSFVRTIGFAVSVLVFVFTVNLFGWNLEIPIEFTSPHILLVLVLVSVGGFLFWNTFVAALAATINDPNTSSKTAFLFVPILTSIGFAFVALKNPDSLLMQILTLVPLTSPAVLSARLVLTDVAVWEVVLAVVLLLGAIALMRRAAGKIFHLGVLMYGKEPTVKEMVRWVQET